MRLSLIWVTISMTKQLTCSIGSRSSVYWSTFGILKLLTKGFLSTSSLNGPAWLSSKHLAPWLPRWSLSIHFTSSLIFRISARIPHFFVGLPKLRCRHAWGFSIFSKALIPLDEELSYQVGVSTVLELWLYNLLRYPWELISSSSNLTVVLQLFHFVRVDLEFTPSTSDPTTVLRIFCFVRLD